MPASLTYLDAALAVVTLLSGLLAMYRGLTREVLSILSWIAAAAAVLYFVLFQKPIAEQLAQQFSAPVVVAQVVAGGLLFLVVLVVVHLITARVSDTILDSRIGIIDRVLGLLFGLARGFVLVVIPFMFYEKFVPDPKQQYPWVRDAQTLPLIKSTGDTFQTILTRVVPPSLMGPKDEQQQGSIPGNNLWSVALTDGDCRRFVIYRRAAG
jgi:membrane protein required for colicin V production